MRVVQRRDLHAVLVDEFRVLNVEPAFLHRLVVQEGAGVWGGKRDLDGVRVDLFGEFHCFLQGFLCLAGQADDEGAVDFDAELVAVSGEALGDVYAHAFFDVVEDLLVAGLVTHEEQAQAVFFQDFQGFVWHVGFGVAGPGDAELAEFDGDGLGAGQVISEGIVVEHEFLHLGEEFFRAFDFGDDVFH